MYLKGQPSFKYRVIFCLKFALIDGYNRIQDKLKERKKQSSGSANASWHSVDGEFKARSHVNHSSTRLYDAYLPVGSRPCAKLYRLHLPIILLNRILYATAPLVWIWQLGIVGDDNFNEFLFVAGNFRRAHFKVNCLTLKLEHFEENTNFENHKPRLSILLVTNRMCKLMFKNNNY